MNRASPRTRNASAPGTGAPRRAGMAPDSPSRRAVLRAALAMGAAAGLGAADRRGVGAQTLPYADLDTPYVTTPQVVVDAMLEMAQVRATDRLLDLGSGDGRIVVTAAARFGARGKGVEIDPRLVRLARENAARAGVADRVEFVVEDLFKTDLSQASVITMYLLPDVNMKLRPALQRLRTGTRIVSHDWGLGDWEPERTLRVHTPEKRVGVHKYSDLMFWVVR
jgi:SAM-dependent methyltransferase